MATDCGTHISQRLQGSAANVKKEILFEFSPLQFPGI